MDDCQSGPVEEKNPRIRTIVNACWNCYHKTVSTDAEHEDGGGRPYCLMDGYDIHLFNMCEDWEEDTLKKV